MVSNIIAKMYPVWIFDMDGVVTQTATVHAGAWKVTFDKFLAGRGSDFDLDLDYLRYVDGKPRDEGILSFLKSRGIEVDEAEIKMLGDEKNAAFLAQLKKGGVSAFSSTVALIKRLKANKVEVGIISASKNCEAVLAAAGVRDLFDVKVDGIDANNSGLDGKPAPDVFLEAARQLEVAPAEAVVVEDALAGVEAARRGGFGLVIGVDRSASGLLDKADIVVADLEEIAIDPIKRDRPIALFCDYDGTLTPIVSRPELAQLADSMRQVLQLLSQRMPVIIMSGRDRADVEQLVGVPGLVYAGSHGFDISGPDLRFEHEAGKKVLPDLDAAETELIEALGGIRGAFVERKKYAIAAHYRLVAQGQEGLVEEAVDKVHQRHTNLRKACGKKIFELQPSYKWNKGEALLFLVDLLKLDSHLPLYIGDDVTDEDAFKALSDKGVGVVVQGRPAPTAAVYRLRDPFDVEEFLKTL